MAPRYKASSFTTEAPFPFFFLFHIAKYLKREYSVLGSNLNNGWVGGGGSGVGSGWE